MAVKSYEHEQNTEHNSEEAYYEQQRRGRVFAEDRAICRSKPRACTGQFPHPVAAVAWRKAANDLLRPGCGVREPGIHDGARDRR